jgi:TonB family protein
MRSFLLMAVGVGLAWQSVSVQARDTRRLPPSSKWIVNYADDSCRLARKFGQGNSEVILIFDQFAPGDWFKLTFVGKSLRPRNELRPINAEMRFGPNELEFRTTGTTATTGSLPTFIVDEAQRLAPLTEAEASANKNADRRNIPYEPAIIGATREKAATWLELKKVLPFDLVLETGSMAKPLAALRDCSWNTVKSWGLDVDQQKSVTQRAFPTSNPATWFSPNEYPREMLNGGYEGIVNFRVMVDEHGKPSSCHIQMSTRPREFDDLVCRSVMKRAKFEPALDAKGKAIPSYWRQTVNYRIG